MSERWKEIARQLGAVDIRADLRTSLVVSNPDTNAWTQFEPEATAHGLWMKTEPACQRIAKLEADLIVACGVLHVASPPKVSSGVRGQTLSWIDCWESARVDVYRSAGLALVDEEFEADMRRAVDAARERWESGGVKTKETQ